MECTGSRRARNPVIPPRIDSAEGRAFAANCHHVEGRALVAVNGGFEPGVRYSE